MATIESAAQELRELIEQLLESSGDLSATAPTGATEISGQVGADAVDPAALEGMDFETYKSALEQVLDDYGVSEEAQADIFDQLEAADDYSPDGLMSHLTIVVSDTSVNTTIDNSIHNTGEVHGSIVQENETNLSNATGEGAIAGRDQYGNFQSGDGQQIDGDNYGVTNQGDNSGQQAGGSATADNVTTGDANMVGSTGATVGDGNSSLDGAYLKAEDSALNIGPGSADYVDTDTDNSTYDNHSTYDDHSDHSDNLGVNDSGNSVAVVEDNDPVNTSVDLDVDVDTYSEPVYLEEVTYYDDVAKAEEVYEDAMDDICD